MISNPINRVQAIKSKFENLNSEKEPVKQHSQLYKLRNDCDRQEIEEKPSQIDDKYIYNKVNDETDSRNDYTPKPNASSLYKIDVKRSVSDTKSTLTRQVSDPGKKLHRSHAFRCERSQKLNSPKRHGSCNGRSETSEFLKMERKLSKDRLKRLGNVLELQMKKENFMPLHSEKQVLVGVVKDVSTCSIPDENVPPHILAQYAQVVKPKKNDDKQEVMTDSGVSSETENLEEDKSGRVKKIMSHFESIEKIEGEVINSEFTDTKTVNSDMSDANLVNSKNPELNSNLDFIEDLAGSSETMKLERKNPNLKLTDTLKKALKQPLPPGPPPKKPPRTFGPTNNLEKEKSDAKRKLEKLEQVLMKHEANKDKNIYDIAEENLCIKHPKEIHYLCTEILDITQRTLLPNQQENQNESPLKNCLNKLNCVANHSMSSLPYTRLSSNLDFEFSKRCSCSEEGLDKGISPLRTFMSEKCSKCHVNEDKEDRFKCHLNCKCRTERCQFFVDDHIYDEPFVSEEEKRSNKSGYGTLNSVSNGAFSKSLEDLGASKIDSVSSF